MIQILSGCTGCHSCADICPKKCIDMKDTGEGFLFPVIHTENCIQCNRCEEVCSVLHMLGRSQHAQVFALKSKDGAEKEKSTSGGVFLLLERRILDAAGIIYGAAGPFFGTPCQWPGLKAFFGKEYENLILVDLICHGGCLQKYGRYT